MIDLLRADSHLSLAVVDQRMRHALTAAARAAGPKAQALMADVLARPASRGGAGEAAQYFGAELGEVIKLMDPMIHALNDGMPGFSAWLDRTGYGDDVGMIRALWAWFESDPEMAVIAARMRHGIKGVH